MPPAPESNPPEPSPPALSRIQREVLGNLLAQPLEGGGRATVADLGLPQTFLARVADRTIRSSYESHFRIVVADGMGEPEPEARPPQQGDRPVSPGIRVVDCAPSAGTAAWWQAPGAGREFRPGQPRFTAPMPAAEPGAERFVAHSDAGDQPLDMLRIQLTSDSYWGGRGAGSSLDIARQLVERVSDSNFCVAIERRFLGGFLSEAASWPLRPGQMRVVPQDLPVSQWAQDNARMGMAHRDGREVPAAILPRFAGRGEEAMTFVPGESLAGQALAGAEFTLVRSDLVFQGGNLLVVPDPVRGERVLLLGEAEVHRNVTPDRSEADVLAAFGSQLAVDRVVVLPAASFHIDYEASPRLINGEVIVLVNDPVSAARVVLRIGIGVLQRERVLGSVPAREALGLLAAGRSADAVTRVGPALYSRVIGPGQFPESFARAFQTGAADSGVGNLHRVLLAMDLLMSRSTAARPGDEHLLEYLAAHRRAQSDREALHAHLRKLGWRVVPIASLGDGDRSMNYVNGVQLPGRYLMPAYGGLFAPLDDLAAEAIGAALGPGIAVIPILCGESQRRQGALRCAIAACRTPAEAP